MGKGYQARDHEIIDYSLVHPPGFPRELRGPQYPMVPSGVADDATMLCFIGAAQTFGCYAERPFPQLVGEQLGVRWQNFGISGAGPEFFLNRPTFLDEANKADVVVVQIMSGRSVSNSTFDTIGLEMLENRATGEKLGALPSYERLLTTLSPSALDELLVETRANWVAAYRAIIAAITVPTVLLWISERPENYRADRRSIADFMGKYPQFVQGDWVDEIKPLATRYVRSVSDRGLPQELISRFTGKPVSVDVRKDMPGSTRAKNHYYPSPEMHADAAQRLGPVCAELLKA